MQTQNDFDGLMDGLVQEQKLVSRINQLQDYLRMGVKTVKDSLIYEKEKAARVMIFYFRQLENLQILLAIAIWDQKDQP